MVSPLQTRSSIQRATDRCKDQQDGQLLIKYSVLQILRCLMSSIDRNIVELLATCWGLIIYGISGHPFCKNFTVSHLSLHINDNIAHVANKQPSFEMEPAKILKELSRHYTSLIISTVPSSEDQLYKVDKDYRKRKGYQKNKKLGIPGPPPPLFSKYS